MRRMLPTVISLLVVATFLRIQLVEGACCTQGQPLYSGSQFRPVLTNFLDFTRIPSTCSDGPCSGIRNGVGYNYKGTGLGSESQNPDSCCDTISLLEGRQTGGSLAWYNPPLNTTIVAGNKTTSWAFDLITGLSLAPVPGTGNPCNRSLPLTICNFDNVPVTYCEGSDFTKGGCGENLVYNTTAANEVASEAKCCREKKCTDWEGVSCGNGLTPVENANSTRLVDVSLYDTTCCRRKSCEELRSTVNCEAQDKKFNEAAVNERPATEADVLNICCMPNTCEDYFNKGTICQGPPDAFTVPKANANSTNTTSASFQTDCCQPQTCAALLSATENSQSCDAGTKEKEDIDSFFPSNTSSFQDDCCQNKTCLDWGEVSCGDDLTPVDDFDNTQLLDVALYNTVCCRAFTCRELKGPGSTVEQASQCDTNTEYIEAYADNITTPTAAQEECCQPITCPDYVNREQNSLSCEPNQKRRANFAEIRTVSFEDDCCEPKTCEDWTEDTVANLTCGETRTLKQTANSTVLLSSDQLLTDYQATCCRDFTCADLKGPGSTGQCDANTEFMSDKANDTTTPGNAQGACCQAITCAERVSLSEGTLSCEPDKKDRAGFNNIRAESFDDCCEPKTCLDWGTEINCGELKPNATASGTQVVTRDDYPALCCEPKTCGDWANDTNVSCGALTFNETASNIIPTSKEVYEETCCRPFVCQELETPEATKCTGNTEFDDDKANTTAFSSNFTEVCCQPFKCPRYLDIEGGPRCRPTKNPVAGFTNIRTLNFIEDCCEDKTCANWRDEKNEAGQSVVDCNNGFTFNVTAQDLPLPDSSAYTQSCCRAEVCGDLKGTSCGANKVFNDARNNSEITGTFVEFCCQPKTCQALYDAEMLNCGDKQYNETAALERPATLNEQDVTATCCEARTCAEWRAETQGGQPVVQCGPNFTFDETAQDIELLTRADYLATCCRAEVCGDLFGRTCGNNKVFNDARNNSVIAPSTYEDFCCQRITCAQYPGGRDGCKPDRKPVANFNNTRPVTFLDDCCESLTCLELNSTAVCDGGRILNPARSTANATTANFKTECCQDKSCLEWFEGVGGVERLTCGDKKYNGEANNTRFSNSDDFDDKCCESYTCLELNSTKSCAAGRVFDSGSSGKDATSGSFDTECCQDKSCLEWLQGIGQEGAESCGTDRKYNETADDLRSADKADFRDLCCQLTTCLDLNTTESCGANKIFTASNGSATATNETFVRDCCRERTCAEGYLEFGFDCTGQGQVYINDTTMQSVTFGTQQQFDMKCCKQQFVTPTCNNIGGIVEGTKQSYPCDQAAPIGGWVFNLNLVNDVVPLPNGTDINSDNTAACCLKVTCLDVDPNKPGDQLWSAAKNTTSNKRNVCCKGYTYNNDTTALKNISPPNDVSCCLPQTCGDMDPNTAANETYKCPGEWVLVPAWLSRGEPSVETCCKRPTCGDEQPETLDIAEPVECCPGTVFNPARNVTVIGTRNPQDLCCLYQTCDDMRPDVRPGKQPFPCAQYGRRNNPDIGIGVQFPDVEKCCLPVETCGNTTRTCTSPSVLGAHNQNRTFTNFQNECCVSPPTCRTAPTSSLGLACNQFGFFVPNDINRDAFVTNASMFMEQCCRPLTCGDRLQTVACNSGTEPVSGSTIITSGFQRDCCKAPPRCRDANQTCPEHFIPVNPTLGYTNFTQTCCRRLTCASARNNNPTRYNCGQLRFNGTTSVLFNNFTAECCRPSTCRELQSNNSCSRGSERNTAAIEAPVTGTYQQTCCQPINPTCSNTDPTAPQPVRFNCSNITTPGGWVYDETRNTQSPPGPSCCKQLDCSSANNTGVSFQCGAGFEFNSSAASTLFTDFKTQCCRRPSCETLRNRGDTCSIGSEYIGTAATLVTNTYQQSCCRATTPTCNNTQPTTPGIRFNCSTVIEPGAWVYDGAKDTVTEIGSKCCKRLTCAAANGTSPAFTCPQTRPYKGPDSNTFTDFVAGCCDEERTQSPTCKALLEQGTRCDTGSEFVGGRNETISSTGTFNSDCCKRTCKSSYDSGARCDSAYSEYKKSTAGTTLLSATEFQGKCCQNLKCEDLKSQGCPPGSSYRTSQDKAQLSKNKPFNSTCCSTPVSATCQSLRDNKAASCNDNWSIFNTSAATLSATVAEYQIKCCRAAKCSELTRKCSNGLTLVNFETIILSSSSFDATCCKPGDTGGCKWPAPGGKCPTFTQTELAASIELGQGSTATVRNIRLTNRFIQKPNCDKSEDISWVNIASCTQCLKIDGVKLGTPITSGKSSSAWSLTDVPCDSVLTIAAHDGAYNKYSDDKKPEDILMPSSCPIRKLGSVPTVTSSATKESSSRSGSSRWSTATWRNRGRVSSSNSGSSGDSGKGCTSSNPEGACYWRYTVKC